MKQLFLFRFILLIFFFFFRLSCLFAQVNLNAGLVAYYPFNGNANDVSGNGHNGQVMNGIQLSTDRLGNANSAYLFDGNDDYIKVPDNGAFSTPNFSLVLWFQSQSDNLQNLVGKRDFTTVGGTAGAQYQFFINYAPFPGIGSNIVGNNSTCTNISSSSYINTADWICRNKWYCAVITFDGSSHKIYIDGVLKKNVPAGFNGFLSCTSELRFGNWWQGDLLPYKGLMDDIRWYNRSLNQQEVTALYANYPTSSGQCGPASGAGFLTPDTVCVNTPVAINNTSVSASSYYWNFCVANSTTTPAGTNLGSFGLSMPVFMDYAQEGNNYYGFVTNNMPGKLIRLDFGNSLLNVPTPVDLGNLGGAIPDQCEGIQVVKNEGKWYALVVGGQPVGRIVKVDFGSSLSNNTPVATNWGNIGNLAYPTDLHVFQDGTTWFGLTINAQTNTITRFNFTYSFTNVPTGTNLGNIGSLDYPTGIYAINDNGYWRAFISNAGAASGFNSPTSSLSRLDFGTSLLNMPTGINLGNPGGVLRSARDLTIYKSCNEIFGLAVNYSSVNDIVRLNFNNSLTTTPTATSLGNIGNLNFPHSISKLFRVDNDLYTFIANVNTNSLTRLKFNGCGTASISNATVQNPPPIVYPAAGTYNINLTVDDGLPTQSAFCKRVVVVDNTHTPLQSKSFCAGDSILLTSSRPGGNQWNTGSTNNSIYVKLSGVYWVQSSNGSCINVDSFSVSAKPLPTVNLGADTLLCTPDSIVLDAGNGGGTYTWQNGQTTQKITVYQAGLYYVMVNKDGCSAKDSVIVLQAPAPVLNLSADTAICEGGTANLVVTGVGIYNWFPAAGLSDTASSTVVARPAFTTKYHITLTSINGCTASDSVTVFVNPKPTFSVASSKPVLCKGDTAILSASGGTNYTWLPSVSLSSLASGSTQAFPLNTTLYSVIIKDAGCKITDTLFINLPVADRTSTAVTKSNDINCFIGQAQLTASGGVNFLWRPSTGLSDSTIGNPVASAENAITYHVYIITSGGCKLEDSITVNVSKGEDGSGYPVPSAFTPNSDGKNDCFSVKYWGAVADFSLNLYNRWGQLVFHTNHPSQCWNGMYRGVPQPSDIYVYWIKAKTKCGNIFRKGTFALIR